MASEAAGQVLAIEVGGMVAHGVALALLVAVEEAVLIRRSIELLVHRVHGGLERSRMGVRPSSRM